LAARNKNYLRNSQSIVYSVRICTFYILRDCSVTLKYIARIVFIARSQNLIGAGRAQRFFYVARCFFRHILCCAQSLATQFIERAQPRNKINIARHFTLNYIPREVFDQTARHRLL